MSPWLLEHCFGSNGAGVCLYHEGVISVEERVLGNLCSLLLLLVPLLSSTFGGGDVFSIVSYAESGFFLIAANFF